MKRNILYLIALILVGTMCMSCDSDDDKTYSDLVLDTELLVIDLDDSAEGSIRIVQGNGNYKLTLSNDRVATVAMDKDNTIRITGLESGKVKLTITDWAKKITTVEIVITKLEELILEKDRMELLVGEIAINSVYSGNGDYTIQSSDPSVATATIDEDGKITIDALSKGVATFDISDKRGKTATLNIKVDRSLLIDRSGDIILLNVGGPQEINILEGNGGYTVSLSSASYVDASISGAKVTLNGKRYGKANTTVTIKDQENKSVQFKVIFVDDPYLTDLQKYRYLANEEAVLQSTTAVGSVVSVPELNISQIYVKTSTSSFASGYGVRFPGDLSVGAKSDASWFKISLGKINESSIAPATDLRIDKIDNGWYWISFMVEGNTERSYIITKQTP